MRVLTQLVLADHLPGTLRSLRLPRWSRAHSGQIATDPRSLWICLATRYVFDASEGTHLIIEQRVHRSALLWLKEWDQCVFKGNSKTSAAAEAKRERRKKRAREGKPEQAEGEEERVRRFRCRAFAHCSTGSRSVWASF